MESNERIGNCVSVEQRGKRVGHDCDETELDLVTVYGPASPLSRLALWRKRVENGLIRTRGGAKSETERGRKKKSGDGKLEMRQTQKFGSRTG